MITIKTENGIRCAYQGRRLVACIYDHRRTSRSVGTIHGDWMVAWTTGRVDWHNRLSEARDNVLKGGVA